MSHRGQSHLKTITRARPVSLKPPIQHLLCIGAFLTAFFWHLNKPSTDTCTYTLLPNPLLASAHLTPCLTHSVQVALFVAAGKGDIEPGVVSVTLKCMWSRKWWSEWILHRDLILSSNFISICVVVFVFEVKINVSGHPVHIVVLTKLAS